MKSKDEIAKEEIVLQAQKLFRQFGLKKTTMDEIAEECGKAKSTLYHYFKNKEEIFDAVIHLELTTLRSSVQQTIENKTSISEKLSTYFLEFHSRIMDKVNLYAVVKNELKNDQKSTQLFNQLMMFETGYITKILQEGFASGEFTVVQEDDIPWFTETVLASFFGIVRYTIENDQGFEVEKMERVIKILVPRLFE